jgi:Holliday junction resolvasome RuvABC endonuclease subunit
VIRLSIGIDPGLAACGVAIIYHHDGQQPWRLIWLETMRTRSSDRPNERMACIHWKLRAIPRSVFQGIGIDELVVACEDQTGVQEGKRRTGQTNASGMLVQQVVGLVRAFAFNEGFSFYEPTPVQVKAVLAGIPRTASKAQVQRAVRALVRDCPKVMSEHASDAIAVALAGARMVR